MNLLMDIQESDFVLAVRHGKFVILKNRNGERDVEISLSEAITLLACYEKNLELRHALTPILEKIKLYETFQ